MIKEINHITGVHAIADRYETYIFDLWGVVHDGINAFPWSIDVIKTLKSAGKTVLILSNSPRRLNVTVEHLTSMGIEKALYDGIYTSGEDCYDRLRLRDHPWYQTLGHTLFHIGPERNLESFTGLGYATAKDPSKADFVLCSGTDGFCTTLTPFYNILETCLLWDLPMVCLNQDYNIQRNGIEYLCAGAIALYYEHKGGTVFYHGKPSQDMFKRVFRFHPEARPKNKILMIGDSLRTDIQGANVFGIDSLFITSGIHWNEQINDEIFARFNALPTWVTARCSW
jgi:HAD superfamily hydrolase (TIGR01459 family)